MFYQVSNGCMTVCVTGRPSPTHDAILYFTWKCLTPVQYIKNRATDVFIVCSLWHKKQLIAECMFCNFNTKALFYAKYFDIF